MRRLRFSRQEAEEILRFTAEEQKLEAVDFAANRKLATSAEMGQYRPAAALRAAQVSMQNDKRWHAPHYWAAFTLQGEWR